MNTYYSNKMSSNPPNFAQLSNINKVKDLKKKVTMRPGFYADMLKTNQFNLLNQNNN